MKASEKALCFSSQNNHARRSIFGTSAFNTSSKINWWLTRTLICCVV